MRPITSDQRDRRVGAELPRRRPHLQPPVHAGEPRLADHHLLQQPLDEERLAAARRAAPRRRRRRRSGGRSTPSSRSICVPSCVPLVRYTPRSRICWSNCVESKRRRSRTASADRAAPPSAAERRRCWRGVARRALLRAARTPARSAGRSARRTPRETRRPLRRAATARTGTSRPTPARGPPASRSSKYSEKPATMSHLVTIT